MGSFDTRSSRSKILSRREWMKNMSMISVGSLTGFTRLEAAETERPRPALRPVQSDYNTYFGDLHMHNNIGYAQGSLRRSFEIAREHLDVYALTPHAHWHDIKEYESNIENKWINGCAVTRARWPDVVPR